MDAERLASAEPAIAARAPQYGRLLGLSWLHFLNDGSGNYLPGILPAVLLAQHRSVTVAGAVMAALMIGQALQVPSGWVADYVGGRAFVLLGGLGTCIAAAAIGLVPNMWLLIPVLMLIGLCSALFHPQALVGARHLSGDRQGLGMSLFLVGGELGRGIWPLAASLIVVSRGLHYLWLLALPALLSTVLLWKAIPPQAPRRQQADPIDWRRHAGPLAALVAFSSLRSLAAFGTITYLPVLWHDRGRGLTEGAALITVFLVVGIIGNLAGGHLADRIGRRTLLCGASLLAAATLAGFLSAGGILQWLLLGLNGVAIFATNPLSIIIGQDIFPENRSLGSGIALGLSNGLAAAALALIGLAASAVAPEGLLWGFVGVTLAAALVSLTLGPGADPA